MLESTCVQCGGILAENDRSELLGAVVLDCGCIVHRGRCEREHKNTEHYQRFVERQKKFVKGLAIVYQTWEETTKGAHR